MLTLQFSPLVYTYNQICGSSYRFFLLLTLDLYTLKFCFFYCTVKTSLSSTHADRWQILLLPGSQPLSPFIFNQDKQQEMWNLPQCVNKFRVATVTPHKLDFLCLTLKKKLITNNCNERNKRNMDPLTLSYCLQPFLITIKLFIILITI